MRADVAGPAAVRASRNDGIGNRRVAIVCRDRVDVVNRCVFGSERPRPRFAAFVHFFALENFYGYIITITIASRIHVSIIVTRL